MEHRITYKILLTTHRVLNSKAPQFITDLIISYIPARNLWSEGEGYLVVPKTHTKTFGESSFSFAAAVEWNKLPKKLRERNTLSQFKSKLTCSRRLSVNLPISVKCSSEDILLSCFKIYSYPFLRHSFLLWHKRYSDWTIYHMWWLCYRYMALYKYIYYCYWWNIQNYIKKTY